MGDEEEELATIVVHQEDGEPDHDAMPTRIASVPGMRALWTMGVVFIVGGIIGLIAAYVPLAF